MAIARPQSLGAVLPGGASVVNAVFQATRGQSYRSMYLQRRKEQYEQILQFTIENEQQRRKMLADMAKDLSDQAASLRKTGSASGSTADALKMWAAENRAQEMTKSFHAYAVEAPGKISRFNSYSSHTIGVLDDVARQAEVHKGSSALNWNTAIKASLASTGALGRMAEEIYRSESARTDASTGLVVRLSANAVADAILASAPAGVSKSDVRSWVAARFGGIKTSGMISAEVDRAAAIKRMSASIPKTDVQKRLDAIQTGDLSKAAALAAADNAALAAQLEAEAAMYRQEVATPISYEDMLAKAAAKQPKQMTQLEQLGAHFKKRRARAAREHLSGGGTEDQRALLSASASAVKVLRASGNVVPGRDTIGTEYAETLYKQWKSGDDTIPSRLVSLATDQAVATATGAAQSELRHEILTHFFTLKKAGEGGVGLPAGLTKEQEDARVDAILSRLAPISADEPSAPDALSGSSYEAGMSEVIEALKKQYIDPTLDEADQIKASAEALSSFEAISSEGTLRMLADAMANGSDAEKNLARGLLANILQDRAAREQESGNLRGANNSRKEAADLISQIPEGYEFDPDIFSGYMSEWHQQQVQLDLTEPVEEFKDE